MVPYKKNLILYYIYTFFSNAAVERGIFILFLIEQGLSNAQIGILQSALFMSNVLAEIPSGFIADKYSRKFTIIVGLILLCVNGLGMVLFSEFIPFLLLFIIHGISFALISGSDQALLYDNLKSAHKEEEYIKCTSIIKALACLSLGLAMALGGWLQQLSWSHVYLSYCGFVLLAMLAFVCVAETRIFATNGVEGASEKISIGMLRRYFAIEKNKLLLLVIVALALFESAITPYYIYGQQLFKENGMPVHYIGIVYAIAEFASALVTLAAVRVARSFSLEKIIIATMLASACLLVANLSHSLTILVLVFLASMIVPDIMEVVFGNFLHSNVPSAIRATMVSIVSFIQSALICVAYGVDGVLLDIIGVANAIALTSVIPIISVCLVWVYFRLSKNGGGWSMN